MYVNTKRGDSLAATSFGVYLHLFYSVLVSWAQINGCKECFNSYDV